MMPRALRGLRRRIAAAWHNHRIGGICRTPPLVASAEGPVYAGMTCHRDARAWLLAVKSIARHVGPGDYAAIDDGTLTSGDKALLSKHLPGLRVIALNQVDTEGCPRGGTWERLITVLRLAANRYVVQVDSDLVAWRPIEELTEAVRAGRSFALAGESGAAVKSLAEASQDARGQSYPHVQHAAEQLLEAMPEAGRWRYLRGCSGLAGFPPGSSPALARQFSQFMQARLGARWQEWGTEQITSNFVVANARDPVVLPWRYYPAFTGDTEALAEAKLAHFIGPARFQRGAYTRASRQVIAQLLGRASPFYFP